MTSSGRQLLIIEDDPGLLSQMRWCFDDSVEVVTAGNADEAVTALRRVQPSVVTLDLGLPPDPGGTSVGFDLLERIQDLAPGTKIIVITGREEHEHAVRAIADGAYDYYQKPIDADTLNFVVDRAFRLFELEAENKRLSADRDTPMEGIITGSQAMLDVCNTAEKVAPTDATVLILGETGTGKELIARAIHELSDRKDGPFIAINCAAIPANLLESELFGHEKGSFTGAVARKIGKMEHANGGTLFLDEIGDMPLPLQSKILRFLQERNIERVGGHQLIEVDVRVVSATHRPIDDMLAEQTFRDDLYFRISEITLTIPPLRDRDTDALLLARAFVQRFAPDRNLRLSSDAKAGLTSWAWPGNVRELENKIKRACILAEGNQISARDLELSVEESTSETLPLNLKQVREQAERAAVLQAINHAEHNLAQTARLLGISRPTLYNLLAKYEIDHGN